MDIGPVGPARLTRMTSSTMWNVHSGHIVLSWPDDLLVKGLLARLTMRQPPHTWPEAWGCLVWNDGAGIVSHPGPPTLWDRLQMLPRLARSLGLVRLTRSLVRLTRLPNTQLREGAHDRLLEDTRRRQGRARRWAPWLAIWHGGQIGQILRSKVEVSLLTRRQLTRRLLTRVSQADPTAGRLTRLSE